MTGYDTAGRIQNTYVSAHREFGTHPNFWIRYFTPSPAAELFHEDALAESRGAWDSGGPYIGVISAPRQSRLSGSAAEGHADAQAFAAALLTAYHAVRPLLLPANNQLYCWLDQEYSTSLSSSYWNAWASYLANYDFAGLGTYPLYPCLYCAPHSPYPNCSTVSKARGVNRPAAIWSSTPEPCGTVSQTAPLERSSLRDDRHSPLAIRRAGRVQLVGQCRPRSRRPWIHNSQILLPP